MRLTEMLAYINGERRAEVFKHFSPELDRYLNPQEREPEQDVEEVGENDD